MNHCGTLTLETERLILRRLRVSDAEAIYNNWTSDPEVTKFLTWPPHVDVGVSRSTLESWMPLYENENYYHWAITLKEKGDEPVGTIHGLVNDDTESIRVGYCLGRDWWHMGIMSEALRALMEFFFDIVEANSINSYHDPNNPHSGMVMKKCGMKYDGTLRSSDRNNQGIVDASWYSILRSEWDELAATDYAKSVIEETTVILDERELRKQLRDTSDSRDMIEKLGAPPVQNVNEMREVLIVAHRGDCLTPYQLERVETVLAVVERLEHYLSRGKQYANPLAYYDENLDSLDYLRDEINRQIRNEAVDDRATKELFDIRTNIVQAEDKMKQKAEQIIRSNKEYMADSFYSLRSGRVCVPVKKEYKFKIPGSVIDKSATGNTLFVEPVGVSKYFEELELLKIDEENEVFKILYTLTAMVSDAVDILEEDMRMIEKLDYIFSKGKLSIDLDCVEPGINLERRISLKAARHPLMDKTVMLNSYMAQCGLHVAAKEADICMNSNYLKA